MYSHNFLRVCGSKPMVGSSKNNTLGWCSKPRAISSLRFIPPENVFTKLLALSSNSTNASNSFARGSYTSLLIPYNCA